MQINLDNNKSIYIDVADKIEELIRLGAYKEDEKLPSVRKLALELNCNPNTIERAYKILEERKVIYTIQKKGMFVSKKFDDDHFKESIIKALKHFKDMNISKDEMLELIDIVWEDNND